ncbi:DNA repair protein complementing XP-C cells homolog [Drosophila busckii]|uniref:DNA repair protein complementing XP-C cells homolog n=1 Tax=Drosophila busckii TaxID=30019 RepID=UPI00083F3838|nr:DNA repair protein complementing XP-C cells homolog [Drosophila busckii]
MSDEEDESLSEGFSASTEDEWKPEAGKDARGGESSDDDDSEFEELPGAAGGSATASGRSSAGAGKKREQKAPSGIKGASVRKRKPSGQSLRSKLYNKYRPPPKTFGTSSPTQNSPSASGSSAGRLTASKNAKTPNESNHGDSSSDCSVDDYLVNPADLDLRSSFFTVSKEKSPVPQFDCNAGLGNLTDSGSEDNNESSIEENAGNADAFDFRTLLENANSLERTRDALLAKCNATSTTPATSTGNAANMDVNALLALGENQNYADEQENERQKVKAPEPPAFDGPSRLSKTKSTRIKRHTKTRPTSTVVAAGDTDDSDFEEVADAQLSSDEELATPNVSGDLEIHVDLPGRHLTKEQKTQHELEMALKRRMNRDIKERQLLMHKASLMCILARSMKYNRLLADTQLMQATLKLLPSKNAYPTERGVELKYLQSFVTWFKTAIKLLSSNLYPPQTKANSKRALLAELLAQVQRKEARSKQDMIFIFIALARAMGMNCRLIVNMQPMALRPQACNLIPIKLKPDERNKSQSSKSVGEEDESESESKAKKPRSKAVSSKSDTSGSSRSKATATSKSDTSGSSRSKATVSSKSDTSGSSKSKATATSKSDTSGSSRSKATATSKSDTSSSSNSKAASSSKSDTSGSSKSKTTAVKKENAKVSPKTEPKCSPTSKISATPIAKRTRLASADAETNVKQSSSKAEVKTEAKPQLARLKRAVATAPKPESSTPVAKRTRKASSDVVKKEEYAEKIGSPVIPKLVVTNAQTQNIKSSNEQRRSRSKSPKVHISPVFLRGDSISPVATDKRQATARRSLEQKARISPTFLKEAAATTQRQLRTRAATKLSIPQLDGGDDSLKRPKLEKLQKSQSKGSDDTDESTPSKQIKKAPVLPKLQQLRHDRRVLSTDDECVKDKKKTTASDMWVELWSEVEEQWICIDLFKGKLHCVDTIRRNASSNLAYVFAFQDDQSIKDVTARYCTTWTSTVRKARVEKAWLDETIAPYLGRRTKRDINEDDQLRRIHSDKPLPKSIAEFKDHPLYVLERHLLKFQGIYPPDAPTLGFIRSEAIYARDCVHLLHSRDIWLKSARVVKLGEQPYKIVKARPKWDKLTRTVIKDQPLEIFGYWQTQDYEPPTAENGLVPRNAYGNVELFKARMLPKKTVHLRLPGLMRVCKKLNIDCANAVVGFDFHQGACHPMYDGFIVCEEFQEIVTAAWEEDQQEQARKEQEKYETRVYGNWKKLIKGLLIRERLKRKYNF